MRIWAHTIIRCYSMIYRLYRIRCPKYKASYASHSSFIILFPTWHHVTGLKTNSHYPLKIEFLYLPILTNKDFANQFLPSGEILFSQLRKIVKVEVWLLMNLKLS